MPGLVPAEPSATCSTITNPASVAIMRETPFGAVRMMVEVAPFSVVGTAGTTRFF